jgi:hypothetical protein
MADFHEDPREELWWDLRAQVADSMAGGSVKSLQPFSVSEYGGALPKLGDWNAALY